MSKYYFSKPSCAKLDELDERLVAIVVMALTHSPIDMTVIETRRSIAKQKELYMQGLTKTLDSKHLAQPKSLAIDIAPIIKRENGSSYIPWDKHEYFYLMAGVILSAAERFCYEKDFYIRWGGDWNRNGLIVKHDPLETFSDLVHFEICNIISA